MKGWYIARHDNLLGYNDKRLVEVGKTHEVKGQIRICKNGLHASKSILQCLSMVNTTNLYRVDVYGDICKIDNYDPISPTADLETKFCGRFREYLWHVDLGPILTKRIKELEKLLLSSINSEIISYRKYNNPAFNYIVLLNRTVPITSYYSSIKFFKDEEKLLQRRVMYAHRRNEHEG